MTEPRVHLSVRQLTDTVVMISPSRLGLKPEATLESVFTYNPTESVTEIGRRVAAEFDLMVRALRDIDLQVLVLPSPDAVHTSDAILASSWFSHHEGESDTSSGTLVIYPMQDLSRRAERQTKNLIGILRYCHVTNPVIIDLSTDEEKGIALEGAGSLVLDRKHKVAYAMESQRTSQEGFDKWCCKMGFEGVFLSAPLLPVYNMSLIVSLGEGFAVACLDAIGDIAERAELERRLREHDREIVPITGEQVHSFCGSILEVKAANASPSIVMSTSAFDAFTLGQRRALEKYGELVVVNISTIESMRGGSVRSMLAEIFPPERVSREFPPAGSTPKYF